VEQLVAQGTVVSPARLLDSESSESLLMFVRRVSRLMLCSSHASFAKIAG